MSEKHIIEMVIVLVSGVVLINLFIGACVLTTLDTEDETFYKWYEDAPFPPFTHFILLTCWPWMAYHMIKYRKSLKERGHYDT